MLVIILGLAAVYRELARPGRILPGIIGAVAIVLGVQALLRHPMSEVGIGLLLAALLLAVTQAFVKLWWIPAAFSGVLAFLGARSLMPIREIGWAAASALAVFTAITAVLVRYAWMGWTRKRQI